ncbi:unnamed protein product [Macrosiphum euphorbiae]|uniref:Uncharacterized protein n=1 Tax=Macrosiphum euphorbiae TaxID=13131 RepID=A0AAV0XUK2_9HEMI|nr:unnamed protein product [Macrosiphum euphorbiae]
MPRPEPAEPTPIVAPGAGGNFALRQQNHLRGQTPSDFPKERVHATTTIILSSGGTALDAWLVTADNRRHEGTPRPAGTRPQRMFETRVTDGSPTTRGGSTCGRKGNALRPNSIESQRRSRVFMVHAATKLRVFTVRNTVSDA